MPCSAHAPSSAAHIARLSHIAHRAHTTSSTLPVASEDATSLPTPVSLQVVSTIRKMSPASFTIDTQSSARRIFSPGLVASRTSGGSLWRLLTVPTHAEVSNALVAFFLADGIGQILCGIIAPKVKRHLSSRVSSSDCVVAFSSV